jgi:hypothetical protein
MITVPGRRALLLRSVCFRSSRHIDRFYTMVYKVVVVVTVYLRHQRLLCRLLLLLRCYLLLFLLSSPANN